MPARTPAETLPYRGPFGGLRPGPALRSGADAVGVQRAWDCLNIETRTGEVRRRPGLAAYSTPASGPALGEIVRLVPFGYPQAGGGPDRLPHAAGLGWLLEGGPTGRYYLAVFLLPLAAGAPLATTPIELATPEAGLLPDGNVVVVRAYGSEAPSVWYKPPLSGAWLLRNLFLARPVAADLTVLSGGNLRPNQEYHYRVVHVNSSTGAVSPASLKSTRGTSTTDKTIQVYVGFSGVTPGVDRFRVYRQATDIDTQFFLIADEPHTTGYWTDDGSVQPDQTVAGVLDELAGYVPAPGRDVSAFAGRLWFDEAPDTLVYTDYGTRATCRLAQSLRCKMQAGDSIRRHLAANELLYVLGRYSIHAVSGSGPESWQVSRLVSGKGLAGDAGVLVVDGSVYLCSDDSLYELNGQGFTPLGADVADWWAQFKLLEKRTLAHDPERDLLIVAGYTQAEGSWWEHPLTLVYHRPTRQWWRWELGHLGAAACPLVENGPARLLLVQRGIYWADAHGNTLALLQPDSASEQRDWGAAAVAWAYDLGHTDGGTTWPKRLLYANLQWAADATADSRPLELRLALQQQAADTLAVPANSPGGRAQLALGRVAETFGLALGGSHVHRPRITALELQAEVIGQR